MFYIVRFENFDYSLVLLPFKTEKEALDRLAKLYFHYLIVEFLRTDTIGIKKRRIKEEDIINIEKYNNHDFNINEELSRYKDILTDKENLMFKKISMNKSLYYGSYGKYYWNYIVKDKEKLLNCNFENLEKNFSLT
jgi:hypothetical protein